MESGCRPKRSRFLAEAPIPPDVAADSETHPVANLVKVNRTRGEMTATPAFDSSAETNPTADNASPRRVIAVLTISSCC